MSTPQARPVYCTCITTVTVNPPHQVCWNGTVYGPGAKVVNVPIAVADEWIRHGWATE